ncbi:MAG: cytochrome d ubiquinol oxidase subunit II [Terriglobales bacterium]
MNVVWFWTLAAMLGAYAVLDGYDLGVGAMHVFLARSDTERRVQLNAIGPLWNGNEVWLIAAGGMMVIAFPRVYAAAFSGFYLALIVVLWLLVVRGVAIEFRGQIRHPLWSAFWDAGFWLASLLLALLLGVALGNLVRGLPVDASGYFRGSFTLMLSPYAMLVGLLSAVVLAWHGCNFIRGRAQGAQRVRAERWSRALWWPALGLSLAATALSALQQPGMFDNFRHFPPALALPAAAVAGFALAWGAGRRAFTGSVLVIGGLLGSAAVTLFPALLRSTVSPAYSLTIYNASSSPLAQRAAWIANAVALVAVVTYSIYIHRRFAGPVRLDEHSY